MNRFLLSGLCALLIGSSGFAEEKQITLTPEAFGVSSTNPNTLYTFTDDESGIEFTGNVLIRTTTAGSTLMMGQRGTSKFNWIIVTKNPNNYNIKSIHSDKLDGSNLASVENMFKVYTQDKAYTAPEANKYQTELPGTLKATADYIVNDESILPVSLSGIDSPYFGMIVSYDKFIATNWVVTYDDAPEDPSQLNPPALRISDNLVKENVYLITSWPNKATFTCSTPDAEIWYKWEGRIGGKKLRTATDPSTDGYKLYDGTPIEMMYTGTFNFFSKKGEEQTPVRTVEVVVRPEAPSLWYNNQPITRGTKTTVEKGKTVNIYGNEDDETIYYLYHTEGSTAEGQYEIYTEPVVINEAGILYTYLVDANNIESANVSYAFDVKETGHLTEGIHADPKDGEQLDELGTIKFTCILPNFSQFVPNNILKNTQAVTVTGPNGFNEKYGIACWQNDGTSGILYTNLNISTPGEYTVTVDFSGDDMKYFNGSMFVKFPEQYQTLTLHYTLGNPATAPELPAVTLSGDDFTGDSYEIPEGQMAKIRFQVAEGVTVYYKWKPETAARAAEEGFEAYEPETNIIINGAGTLTYYAEANGVKSDKKDIVFTVEQKETPIIPVYIQNLDPEDGSTRESIETITFDIKPKNGAYAFVTLVKGKATITGPDGTSTADVTITNQNTGATAINVNAATPGEYTILVNLDGMKYMDSNMNWVIFGADDKFTLHYTISVPSAIDGIYTEESEAVYYDLNGRRVNCTPDAGIYIRVTGDKVTKVIRK